MAKYDVEFSGSGDLEKITFDQITAIGKFLDGSFVVDSAVEATVETPKDLTFKLMNTALAKVGIRNLTTSSIEPA